MVGSKLGYPVGEGSEKHCRPIPVEQDFRLAQLRRPSIYKPFIIGVSLMVFQQLSGINAVMFYAETIFEEAKFKVKKPPPCLIQMSCGCGRVTGSLPDGLRPISSGQQPGLGRRGHLPGAVHSRGGPHHGQSWAEAAPGLVR